MLLSFGFLVKGLNYYIYCMFIFFFLKIILRSEITQCNPLILCMCKKCKRCIDYTNGDGNNNRSLTMLKKLVSVYFSDLKIQTNYNNFFLLCYSLYVYQLSAHYLSQQYLYFRITGQKSNSIKRNI